MHKKKMVIGIVNAFLEQEKQRAYSERQLNHDICQKQNGKSLCPISRSHAKQIALAYAARVRSHKFNRVSRSFLNAVESNTLNFIKDRVNRHASKGVTLQ
jgi:hypothetical protein